MKRNLVHDFSLAKQVSLLLIALMFLRSAEAQDPMLIPGFPTVVNGSTSIVAGDTLYVGGRSTTLGGYKKSFGSEVDLASGKPNMNFPDFNNLISCVIADGNGGWYIGGTFTQVGGLTRNRLARVNADGSVHNWNPDVTAGDIAAMAVAPNGKLYIGTQSEDLGMIGGVGGFGRLAAIDISTGAADASFQPVLNASATPGVKALLVNGNILYIGGLFHSISGTERYGLAAIDVNSQTLTAWNPNPIDFYNGTVSSMALDGNTLYAGGDFMNAGGQSRNKLAAFDLTTGNVTDWNPNVNGSDVRALTIHDNILYVGGRFTAINGMPRMALASFYLNNGSLTELSAEVATTFGATFISSMAIAGNHLYFGGSFQTVNFTRRGAVAAIDITTGLLSDWESNTDANLADLHLSFSNGRLFTGGEFSLMGGKYSAIIAIKISTREILNFRVDIGEGGNFIYSLAVKDNKVYAGGTFSYIGGGFRSNLASFDRATGIIADWDPQLSGTANALLVKNNTLYVGGDFSSINESMRSNLASFDLTNGDLTSWNPETDNGVTKFAASDDRLYVGMSGEGNIGGASRKYLGSFNLADGLLTDWSPQATSSIAALTVKDAVAYTSSTAFSTTTGDAIWDFNTTPESGISALNTAGNTLFAAGSLTSINGVAKTGLAAITIPATLAIPNGWEPPAITGLNNMPSISAKGDTVLFITGSGELRAFSLPVIAQQQTISFSDITQTYGDADLPLNAIATSGLGISYTIADPSIAAISNGMLHILKSGSTTITASQPGNASTWLPATDVTVNLTVSKAALIITADNKEKAQGDANPALTVSYTGFVNNENEAVLTIAPTVVTTATQTSVAGAYPITVSDAVADNYSITYTNGTLTINPPTQQPQTIIFTDIIKTYGDADFAPDATVNSGLAVSYISHDPAVATIVNGKIHIAGAGTAIITASQAGNAFWFPATDVTATLTVNKAALTIAAEDKAKTEGQANPSLTITYNGFVNGETSAVLTTLPSVSTTATQNSPAGTYPISVAGATASNYAITHVNGTLTINPRVAQNISFGDMVKTYGNADFNPGAAASSGLEITYVSDNPAVAAIVNGTINIRGAGTANITAKQNGDNVYSPATDVIKVLTVNKAALNIRAEDKSRMYNEPNPSLTVSYSGFVNGETLTSLTSQPLLSTTATIGSVPGTYPITASGAVASNYVISYSEGALIVKALPVTVSKVEAAFAGDMLQVKVYSATVLKAVLQVADLSGRVMLTQNISLANGLNTYQLPAFNIARGAYIVLVRGEGLNVSDKIIK